MNRRPTRKQLLRAINKRVPDILAPNPKVLFVGINPGLYSAAVGHHFARPGNRFWPALHAAGFTPRLFSPFEESKLVDLGYGITNIVARATVRAEELNRRELVAGAKKLAAKVRKYHPRFVAIIGVGAFRIAFDQPGARVGRQDEPFEGATLWLLPNPSGLNAHYQPADLKRIFGELRSAVAEQEHR